MQLTEAVEASVVIDRMIEAAGGRRAMDGLGYLQSVVKEEETLASGRIENRSFTSLVRTEGFSGMHVDIGNDTSLYCNPKKAWAMRNGELDARPQTPRYARGSIYERLLPILAPFFVEWPGVFVEGVDEGEWERQAVWELRVLFPKNFFFSAVLTTTWTYIVRQSDGRLLAMEVYPQERFRKVLEEGYRYRLSSFTELEGVSLPKRILVEGLDFDGVENGHFKIIALEHRLLDGIDPILFVDPAEIEALDESDFPDL